MGRASSPNCESWPQDWPQRSMHMWKWKEVQEVLWPIELPQRNRENPVAGGKGPSNGPSGAGTPKYRVLEPGGRLVEGNRSVFAMATPRYVRMKDVMIQLQISA